MGKRGKYEISEFSMIETIINKEIEEGMKWRGPTRDSKSSRRKNA